MSSSTFIYKQFFGPNNPEVPLEVSLQILAFLSIKDHRSVALVSHVWNLTAKHNLLWEKIVRDSFPSSYADINQKNMEEPDWREEAKSIIADQRAALKRAEEIANLKKSLNSLIENRDKMLEQAWSHCSHAMNLYSAAQALESVLFAKGDRRLLEKYAHYYAYSQYYDNEDLVSIYTKAQDLGLIANEENVPEETQVSYRKPGFN